MALERTKALFELVGACLLVLLVALGVNGLVTLSSLNRIVADSLLTQAEVAGGDVRVIFERSIRFGRPLGQFLGLDSALDDLRTKLPANSSVAVAEADGRRLSGDAGLEVPDAIRLALAGSDGSGDRERTRDRDVERRASGAVVMETDDVHLLGMAINERDGTLAGVLAIAVDGQAVRDAIVPLVRQNLVVLAATTSAAVLGVIWFLGAMFPRGSPAAVRTSPRALLALPVAAVIAAQAIYTWDTISSFRSNYIELTRANAEFLGQRMGDDIGVLVERGLQLDSMRGLEEPIARVAGVLPAIDRVVVRGADGGVLHRIDMSDPSGSLELTSDVAAGEEDLIRIPIRRAGMDEPIGHLGISIDPQVIADGVADRLLDAATVILVSALFALELFVLLYLWIGRAFVSRPAMWDEPPDERLTGDDTTRHLLARPVAFLLVLAWALPLSFLPLAARELPTSASAVPPEILIALPISAEMLCALATALLAGHLTDRYGWHVPTILGLLAGPLASLMSAAAPTLETFVLARGVTGLAYGLAWMGIQGYVFQHCTPLTRAQGIANLVAGIFTGQIAGMVVGAMIAERYGYAPVFLVGAVLALLPLLFVLAFLRVYMTSPTASVGNAAPVTRDSFMRLARSKDFMALLAGSVVPFSIAQVGLLYYAVPLLLSAEGVGSGSIGRIMMIYGLCVILIGPAFGRIVDRSASKRPFIAAGGLIGGGGMAVLYFSTDVLALTFAVFALGLAASLAGAAQSAYALALPVVQKVGSGRAMGVQRAADKLGQMFGPLVVGTLFPLIGVGEGLAVTGFLYAGASALFLLVAASGAARQGPAAAPDGPVPAQQSSDRVSAGPAAATPSRAAAIS